MPQAKNVVNQKKQDSPTWNHDPFGRDNLVPGGHIVEPGGFTAQPDGRIFIPSGTLLGRTYAERTTGLGFGPADPADEEIYLLCYDVYDANLAHDHSSDEVDLYRHNRLIYEDKLPGWATMSAALKALIRSKYECILSTNENL